MKKTKIVLPIVAFALAIVGVFVSRQSKANTMVSPDYIYNQQDQCAQILLSCNNDASAPICEFNPGTGYTYVFDDSFHATLCATYLRHSLNNGKLN